MRPRVGTVATAAVTAVVVGALARRWSATGPGGARAPLLTPTPTASVPTPPRVEPLDQELPDAAEVQVAYLGVRRQLWSGLLTIPFVGFWIAALVVWVATPPGEIANEDSTRAIVLEWRSGVSGLITPADSLTFAVALLAVIATVNIAVSFPAPRSSVIDQVATMFWSNALRVFTFCAAAVAVALALVNWASTPHARSSVGVLVAVSVIAAGCVVLSATIGIGSENAAQRRRSLSQIEGRLEQVDARLERALGFRSTAAHVVAAPARGWAPLRHAGHVLVAAVGAAVITVAISATGTGVLGAGEGWRSLVIPSVIWMVLVTSVVWYFGYLRWTGYHRREQWSLRVSPWIFRALWLGLALMLAIVAGDGADSKSFDAGVVLTALTPAIPIALFALGRPDRHAPVLGWAARPVWGAVVRSLESRRAELTERRREKLQGLRSD
ncbi:hypothetical protein [Rhodococcus sp. NPDC127528]|uniref:hypothetical protein n=1 Tax=unclassified Rhodococcus (in: high G+C Gram-positive bacteria) TaxID=192944 RepID=UPI003634AFA8